MDPLPQNAVVRKVGDSREIVISLPRAQRLVRDSSYSSPRKGRAALSAN